MQPAGPPLWRKKTRGRNKNGNSLVANPTNGGEKLPGLVRYLNTPLLLPPLQSDEERKKACNSLYEVVRAINVIQSNWIFKMIMARLINDDCTQGDVQFSNLLLVSITEYHLTASVRPYSSIGPILPKEIDQRLPHISEYMPPEDVFSTEDVRLKDAKAAVLMLATWLH